MFLYLIDTTKGVKIAPKAKGISDFILSVGFVSINLQIFTVESPS